MLWFRLMLLLAWSSNTVLRFRFSYKDIRATYRRSSCQDSRLLSVNMQFDAEWTSFTVLPGSRGSSLNAPMISFTSSIMWHTRPETRSCEGWRETWEPSASAAGRIIITRCLAMLILALSLITFMPPQPLNSLAYATRHLSCKFERQPSAIALRIFFGSILIEKLPPKTYRHRASIVAPRISQAARGAAHADDS